MRLLDQGGVDVDPASQQLAQSCPQHHAAHIRPNVIDDDGYFEPMFRAENVLQQRCLPGSLYVMVRVRVPTMAISSSRMAYQKSRKQSNWERLFRNMNLDRLLFGLCTSRSSANASRSTHYDGLDNSFCDQKD